MQVFKRFFQVNMKIKRNLRHFVAHAQGHVVRNKADPKTGCLLVDMTLSVSVPVGTWLNMRNMANMFCLWIFFFYNSIDLHGIQCHYSQIFPMVLTIVTVIQCNHCHRIR